MVAVYKPGSQFSPGTQSANTLILACPALGTVRSLLFKAPSLWHFVTAAQALRQNTNTNPSKYLAHSRHLKLLFELNMTVMVQTNFHPWTANFKHVHVLLIMHLVTGRL